MGGDNFAFGFDVLVALKTNQVGHNLARLQFGQEMNAAAARAESGGRE